MFIYLVTLFCKTYLDNKRKEQGHNQKTNSLQLVKVRNNIRLLIIIIYFLKNEMDSYLKTTIEQNVIFFSFTMKTPSPTIIVKWSITNCLIAMAQYLHFCKFIKVKICVGISLIFTFFVLSKIVIIKLIFSVCSIRRYRMETN